MTAYAEARLACLDVTKVIPITWKIKKNTVHVGTNSPQSFQILFKQLH